MRIEEEEEEERKHGGNARLSVVDVYFHCERDMNRQSKAQHLSDTLTVTCLSNNFPIS